MKLVIVPAREGATWVKLGLRTFFRQPLAFTGLFLIFVALVSLLSVIPWIGNVLGLALMPALTLGFFVASRQASQGRFLVGMESVPLDMWTNLTRVFFSFRL
jgi:membrane-bound ClpP family serine protease